MSRALTGSRWNATDASTRRYPSAEALAARVEASFATLGDRDAG